MHCGSCINHITNIVNRLGVIESDINLERKFGRFTFKDEVEFADIIIDEIQSAGYETEKLSVIDAEDPKFN